MIELPKEEQKERPLSFEELAKPYPEYKAFIDEVRNESDRAAVILTAAKMRRMPIPMATLFSQLPGEKTFARGWDSFDVSSFVRCSSSSLTLSLRSARRAMNTSVEERMSAKE